MSISLPLLFESRFVQYSLQIPGFSAAKTLLYKSMHCLRYTWVRTDTYGYMSKYGMDVDLIDSKEVLCKEIVINKWYMDSEF